MAEEQEKTFDAGALRAELKQWENEFRAAHGRKAERVDIKNDAIIATKYQQYKHITKRADSQPTLPPLAATPKKNTRHVDFKDALRERPRNAISATPKKTPSKPKHTTGLAPALSPVQEVLPTPQFIRNALGPTPQKDGQVLGIFDIVSGGTPAEHEHGLAPGMETVIAGTPSKATHLSSETPLSKTPQSAGKRYFLDSFAGTPLKRKREDDIGTTSSSKRKFATPSFLRRSFPLASINEESTEITSTHPPFRKRGLVRSLSSIIQGLRKQENKDADDEWDILNEIEAEEQGMTTKKKVPEILVEDSQTAEMPLGPDQAPESDGEASDDREKGITRKPWKKKGLKRQTRRVNMRPVLHKPKKADDYEASYDEEVDVIPETQLQDVAEEEEEKDQQSGASEFEDGVEQRSSAKKAAKKKKKEEEVSLEASKPTAKEKKKQAEKKDGKKPRKVNPDAHANFRKLKIKNKNSKANGRGGRFGRR